MSKTLIIKNLERHDGMFDNVETVIIPRQFGFGLEDSLNTVRFINKIPETCTSIFIEWDIDAYFLELIDDKSRIKQLYIRLNSSCREYKPIYHSFEIVYLFRNLEILKSEFDFFLNSIDIGRLPNLKKLIMYGTFKNPLEEDKDHIPPEARRFDSKKFFTLYTSIPEHPLELLEFFYVALKIDKPSALKNVHTFHTSVIDSDVLVQMRVKNLQSFINVTSIEQLPTITHFKGNINDKSYNRYNHFLPNIETLIARTQEDFQIPPKVVDMKLTGSYSNFILNNPGLSSIKKILVLFDPKLPAEEFLKLSGIEDITVYLHDWRGGNNPPKQFDTSKLKCSKIRFVDNLLNTGV